MYNTDIPSRRDLPTSGQLAGSTVVALIGAIAILVTVVLPAEYAIDPTGLGRVLGLTQMGEIKAELADEAAADAAAAAAAAPEAEAQEAAVAATAETAAAETETAEAAAEVPAAETAEAVPPGRSDEVSFTLAPGEGAEIKLVMTEGATANYAWTANGAVVNFDAHGNGGGQSITYEKGRGVAEDEGVLEAAFDGDHGWFWRNRTDADVTITLRTQGDYADIKRVL